jgi:hypothetical protein
VITHDVTCDSKGIFGMMAGGRPRMLTDEDLKKRECFANEHCGVIHEC